MNCAYYTKYGQSYLVAEEAFINDNITKAFNKCIESLTYHPEYYYSLILIEKILPKLIQLHHDNIDVIKKRNKEFYWDAIVNELIILNDIVYKVINLNHRRSDYWLRISEIRDYKPELEYASENAANSHYRLGIELLEKNTITNRLSAATEFKKCLDYIDNYLDAKKYYEENRFSGKVRLLILPFNLENIPKKFYNIFFSINKSIKELISRNTQLSNAIEIINPHYPSIYNNTNQKIKDKELFIIANEYNATHILSLEILSMDIDIPRYDIDTSRFNNGNMIDYNVYVDENSISQIGKIYGDVQAEFYKYSINANCELITNYKIYRIIDKKIIQSLNLFNEAPYLYEWGKFIGEKRALNINEIELLKNKEISPPTQEYLINLTLNQLLKDLFDDSEIIFTEEIKK